MPTYKHVPKAKRPNPPAKTYTTPPSVEKVHPTALKAREGKFMLAPNYVLEVRRED